MNTIQILQLAVAADPGLGEIRDKHRSAAKELLPAVSPINIPRTIPRNTGLSMARSHYCAGSRLTKEQVTRADDPLGRRSDSIYSAKAL